MVRTIYIQEVAPGRWEIYTNLSRRPVAVRSSRRKAINFTQVLRDRDYPECCHFAMAQGQTI